MHLAKHMQFHGVDYIVVPKELWDEVKEALRSMEGAHSTDRDTMNELLANMQAYDNSNEPVEIPNE